MKVIFLKDVPKVGQKYEIKNIADGYARNFLLPKGLVEIVTDKTVARIELLKKSEEVEREVQKKLLLKNIEDLDGIRIVMKEKANEKGHLFAGIHPKELVKEIKKQTRLEIEPDSIELEKPIRELGEHAISADVHGKKAKFILVVEAT